MKKFYMGFFRLLSVFSLLLVGCSTNHSQQTIEQHAPPVSQSSGNEESGQRQAIPLGHGRQVWKQSGLTGITVSAIF